MHIFGIILVVALIAALIKFPTVGKSIVYLFVLPILGTIIGTLLWAITAIFVPAFASAASFILFLISGVIVTFIVFSKMD
jgi:hypothetical protein